MYDDWRKTSRDQVNEKLMLPKGTDNILWTEKSSLNKRNNINSQVTGEIRLSGGSSKYQGLLEIQVNTLYTLQSRGNREQENLLNHWIPVCGDGWNILAASIACHQLDLGFALNALQDAAILFHSIDQVNHRVNKKFIQSNDTSREIVHKMQSKVFIISCSGDESKLSQCNLTLTSMDTCSHSQAKQFNAAGVICTQST